MKGILIVKTIVLSVVISGIFGGSALAMAGQRPQRQVGTNDNIRLNSLGYLPAAQKKASIVGRCSDFAVKDASTGKEVYSGKTTGPVTQSDVHQDVWIADFSKVNKPGKYYLEVKGVGSSYEFEIGDKVYNEAFRTSMRAFYLWRCGTAVEGNYKGNHYSHAACHTDDALQDYIGLPNSKRDGTGGWHDAGDYNKYVVNAGVTVGAMFLAWEHFGDKIQKISLGIPDTAKGYPDFLKEMKWEIDWLFKMQMPDGSGKISHKLSARRFCSFVMPEDEPDERYYSDWSTAATADFVAMTAMAARYFKPYDADYAQKCLDAAKKSYAFLKANPGNKMADLAPFRTGRYNTDDQDDRVWAAAEMWETTGEQNYLKDFERGSGRFSDKVSLYWDWGEVRNLGMFTYILSKREGKRDAVVSEVKEDLITVADMLVIKSKRDVYGRCVGGEYKWGCNGAVARVVLTLQAANMVSPKPDYVNASLDSIAHLFGRNYYCRSYVTGLGYKPPMNPHSRRSGADNVRDPWPGYIVGGGHHATDWQDIEPDARTNEIAINWQAALVYALAGFVN